ncbi:MAG: XRE family transcriptional regulator [Oscillospiraceae bacterium]|nr:XRE family transcriptional regulator [Oscillospiraceae bacterium]
MAMELHERLKSLRENKKLTKTKLTERLKIPYTTYNNWEISASKPQIPDLCMLADFYGVTVDYLVGHSIKELPVTEAQAMLQKYGRLSDKQRRLVNVLMDSIVIIENENEPPESNAVISAVPLTRKIPLFGQPASAGAGVYLDSDDAEMLSILDIPEYREADMAIRVNGDSMTPGYKNGDIVLVRAQPFLDIGDIGVFIYNGEGYIKKLEREGLVSLNPKYAAIRVNELGSFETVGKVLCVI